MENDRILDAFAEAEARKATDPAGFSVSITKLRALLVAELHELFGPEIQRGISHPQRGISEPMRAPKPNFTNGSFLDQIIGTLQQFFAPGGGQIFTLQFPGRFLQMTEYAWDTKTAGIYGQIVKPLAVNEGEFRLTDQLYDVADVVSGPNGKSLSQAYDQVINNLLPAYRSSKLTKQQQKIRGWLLKDVETAPWIEDLMKAQQAEHSVVPGRAAKPSKAPLKSSSTGPQPAFAISHKLTDSSKKINRMELSTALMQEYLDAKNAWESERDAMLAEALKLKLGSEQSAEALNNLTRKLAHTTAAREAQLAAKY